MSNSLLGYSRAEKEAIIRSYLGAGAEAEWPLCRHCGEDFAFALDSQQGGESRVRVHCPGCANGFTWSQLNSAEPWELLHLDYFRERFAASQPLRCPVDDCGVTAIELYGGEIEFRCPFCNRRGRVDSLGSLEESEGPADLENLPG